MTTSVKWVKDRHSGKKRKLASPKLEWREPPDKTGASSPHELFAHGALVNKYSEHEDLDNIIYSWSVSLMRGMVHYTTKKETLSDNIGYNYIHKFRVLEPLPVFQNEGETLESRWHGTGVKNAFNVLKEGRLRIPLHDRNLLLGKGIYLAEYDKACMYLGKNDYSGLSKGNSQLKGVLFKVKVAFGKTEIQKDKICKDMSIDTIIGVPGVTKTNSGVLIRPEWCVRDPERVSVVEVWLFEFKFKQVDQHGVK